MTNLTILVNYDGKWVSSNYKGGKTKALVVSEKVAYEELRNRLYSLVRVDPNEYGITMKAVYSGKSVTYPVEVVDDNDVTAFVCESLARDWKIPLCISLERRVLASGSGSNQRAPVGLATQTAISASLHPHTELQEQSYIALSSDLVPVDFSSATQADSDCGDGLIHDDLENDKQNDDIEVDMEHHNMQRDGAPHDSLHSDEAPPANLQFHNMPQENMQFDNIPLHYPNSPPCTRDSSRLTEQMDKTILNAGGDIGLGSLYTNKKDLQEKLGITAIRNNFEFRVKRSTTERFVAACVNDNCTWQLHAYKSRDSENFVVRRYDSHHSCSLNAIHHSHRQASSLLIGQYVKSKYKDVSRKPKDIIEDVRKDFGVNISYGKAYRASQCASEHIRGSPKESSSTLRPCKRSKKERLQPDGDQQSTTRKCGKCGATGHYSKTCSNPINLHPNTESECYLELEHK